MHFDLIDEYLLTGAPRKAQVIETLLRERSDLAAAAPFYEGMRILGARTPDLTLVALRLVLAGKRADDASVVALREHADAARKDDEGSARAREAYKRALLPALLLALLIGWAVAPVRAQTASPNVYKSLESGSPHHAAEIRGRIVSIDYAGESFVVASGGTQKLVAVMPTTTLSSHGAYTAFADLRKGQQVDVTVVEVDGHLVAQTIRI
jgi:hypothetical protein